MEAAAADEPRQGEREYPIHVAASGRCSSRAELRKELERQLPGYQFPDAAAEAARINVSFAQGHAALDVDIRLEKAGGEVLSRHLAARDCDEARLAVSFVISVALEGSKAELNSGAGTGASSAAASSKPSASAPDTASNDAVAPLLVAETATIGRTRKGSPRDKAKIDSWLSARLAILGGPAPNPLLGGALSFGIGDADPGAWAPAFELELAYAAAFSTHTPVGSASFDVGTFGLAACPSLAQFGLLRLRPCLLGHFGFLRAVGSDTFEPGNSTRPWVDVGLRLDALVRLNRRFDLYLGVDGRYNFNQDKFLFDSNIFHSIPPVSVGGAVGVVIHFQ